MNPNSLFAVLLPAAGSGQRFGGGDKLLVDLAGLSVLQRSVLAFAQRSDVTEILLITAPERFAAYRAHLRPVVDDARLLFVAGGRERWESVLFGLRALRGNADYVAIHDAARPLVSQAVIDAAFAGALAVGGSVPVVAEPATLKRLDPASRVLETVPRHALYQAQTPQCFARVKLLEAYESLLARHELGAVTDDAQVFEKHGLPVLATPGSPLNIKITTAADVALANSLLQAIPPQNTASGAENS